MTVFNRYAAAIGILLVAVVFSPDPGRSRAIGAMHDFAHAPIFGCVALLALMWLKRRPLGQSWPVWKHYVVAFAAATLLGLATEIAQKYASRDASWVDLRSDILGAAAFCCLYAFIDPRVTRFVARIGGLAIAVTLLVVHSIPFAGVGLAYLQRNREFPTLFAAQGSRLNEFVAPLRSQIGYASLPAPFAAQSNEKALHVRFGAGRWTGVGFDEPYPDWSGYRTLSLDLTNPGDQVLKLTIRVHDRLHDWTFDDRFNRSFSIAPRTRLNYAVQIADIERAALTRRLDIKRIAHLQLFTAEGNTARDLYLSRVWLE